MKVQLTIPVAPLGKPRMTRADAWKKRPAVQKYWKFKDDIKEHIKDLPPEFEVVFCVPMAKSWSKRRRADMHDKPHQQKPDIDNYLKALLDAVCEDDSYVYKVTMSKRWAVFGSIILTVNENEIDNVRI